MMHYGSLYTRQQPNKQQLQWKDGVVLLMVRDDEAIKTRPKSRARSNNRAVFPDRKDEALMGSRWPCGV